MRYKKGWSLGKICDNINRVIFSCQTKEQLKVAQEYFQILITKTTIENKNKIIDDEFWKTRKMIENYIEEVKFRYFINKMKK